MDRDDDKMREALRRVAGLLEAVAQLIEAAVSDDDETPVVRVEPMEASQPTRQHYCDAATRRVAISEELLASMARAKPGGIVEVDPVSRDAIPRPVPATSSSTAK